MKSIKSYKLFEAYYTLSDDSRQNIRDIKENINDVLIELKDSGWFINIEYNIRSYHNKRSYFSVEISKSDRLSSGVEFKFSDISDEVLRIADIYKNEYEMAFKFHKFEYSRYPKFFNSGNELRKREVLGPFSVKIEDIYKDEFKDNTIISFYIDIYEE